MRSFPYGGENILFTDEEVSCMRSLFHPGIELIGFKSIQSLKPHYNIKHSYFLYPSDERILDSRKVFTALLEKCAEKGVMAICRFVPRKTSVARMVAMIPQLEIINAENEVQEAQPGFHVVILPVANDLRSIAHRPTIDFSAVDEESDLFKVKQKAAEVVQALKLHPGLNLKFHFPNPQLQVFYNVMEAMALQLEDTRETFDTTLPDKQVFEANKELLQEYQESVPASGSSVSSKPKGRKKAEGAEQGASKRKAAPKKRAKKDDYSDEDDEKPVKRSKKKQVVSDDEDEDDEMPKQSKGKKRSKKQDTSDEDEEAEMSVDDEEWKETFKDGKLTKKTVADLKEFIKAHKKVPKGKKADLVKQAEEILESLE
jgi:ATP-dependent DNA helicase 2 subunit 1